MKRMLITMFLLIFSVLLVKAEIIITDPGKGEYPIIWDPVERQLLRFNYTGTDAISTFVDEKAAILRILEVRNPGIYQDFGSHLLAKW